ncbi:MAG: retropepsin-like domain-containing protein [Actinomycetota bacterium]|nr:retropepsin-like domain-containing protein [Actinomycetota bacterium]
MPLYVFLLLILSMGFAWALFRAKPAAVQAENAVILGEEEMIELSAREGGETIEVLAKVDMGAGYSSIDEDLTEDLGMDLDDPEDTVKIDSANGVKRRPLVRVRIKVAGKTLDTASR